jgi:ATP-dependent exoDNAse (exonuclease V) alpha subunit
MATEQAIEDLAQRLTERDGSAVVPAAAVEDAIAAKERGLGAALTAGQRRAARQITTSGRGLDLVVGVAGSGKTAALDVARSTFEAAGYRVLGTAISGQAARTLGEAAGVERRTIASLVWGLEHGSLRLDDRTVLLIDEAGMADDPAMLKLLAAVDVAGAKAVVIGDHRQLGAVGPGGGLEALVNRHGPAVHVLDENIRQRDVAERQALKELRAGSVAAAVDWYRTNGRLVTAPTRDEVLAAVVDVWFADVRAGREAVLMAWRRSDVAALNERARQRFIAAGLVAGPELDAPGGRRYAAGDRVVTLATGERGRFVTSERGTVAAVHQGELTVRFDDGRSQTLTGEEVGADRLDHAYAVTVHRMQGATVDHAHVFADGGGRELAYVAMSRARGTSQVYVVADDLQQGAEDLHREWSSDRRQRWIMDLDEPARLGDGARPCLAPRATGGIRLARLRAERNAIAAMAPEATARLEALDVSLRPQRLEVDAPQRQRGLGLA